MVLRGSHQCAGWQQSFVPNNLTEDPDVEESLQKGDRAKRTDEGKLRYPAMNRSKPLPPREKKTGGGMCPESREIQGLAGGPPGGTVDREGCNPCQTDVVPEQKGWTGPARPLFPPGVQWWRHYKPSSYRVKIMWSVEVPFLWGIGQSREDTGEG